MHVRSHLPWSLLSLLAVLLLNLTPASGRMAQALAYADADTSITRHAAPTEPALHAKHADSAHASLPLQVEHSPAAPSPHEQHKADCDYCPLLSALLGFALAVLLLAQWTGGTARIVAVARACRWQRHPCGLGSRGPPLAA